MIPKSEREDQPISAGEMLSNERQDRVHNGIAATLGQQLHANARRFGRHPFVVVGLAKKSKNTAIFYFPFSEIPILHTSLAIGVPS